MTNSVLLLEQVEKTTICSKGTENFFRYGISLNPDKYFERALFINTALALAMFLYIPVRMSFAGKTFEDLVPYLNVFLPVLYLILGLSFMPFFWPGFGKTGRIKIYCESKPVIETRIRIVTRRNLLLQRRVSYWVGARNVTGAIQKIALEGGTIPSDKVRFYRDLFASDCCLPQEELTRLPIFIWGMTS